MKKDLLRRLNGCYCLARSFLRLECSYLIFFVTSECNARCRMCFYWKEIERVARRPKLSIQEIGLIAKNFKHLAYLSITGGEPTLRDDLDEIVYNFYAYSRTRLAAFSTNGLLSDKTEEAVASMLKSCPHLTLKVNISIDHIGNKHDEIRGIDGAFAKAIETFSRLKGLKRRYGNLYLSVGTVLSSYNAESILEIIDHIKRMNPDAHSIELARGDVREKDAKDVTIAQYEKVMNYLKEVGQKRRGLMQSLVGLTMDVNFKTLKYDRMMLPCVAGTRILTLTEEGLVTPCEMLRQLFPEGDFVMGDLRKCGYDIKKVLGSKKSEDVLDFIKRSKCHCSFECATFWNILFNYKMYPTILAKVFS